MSISHQHTGRQNVDVNSTLTISELVEITWRRKWMLVGCVVVPLLLGAVYLIQADPVFQIAARLVVEQRGLPLEPSERSRKDEYFLATQAEIIRSPAIVQRALQSVDVSSFHTGDSDPLVTILQSLTVTPIEGTNVLSVGLSAANQTDGIRVVEAIIGSYQVYLNESERGSHIETLRLLTENEKELRTDLTALQGGYQQLRENSPVMGQGKDAGQVGMQLLTQLGQTLVDVRNRRIELQNRIGILRETRPDSLALGQQQNAITVKASPIHYRGGDDGRSSIEETGPEIRYLLAHPTTLLPAVNDKITEVDYLASIREDLSRARVRESELARHSLGPMHPEIKVIREQIEALESRLNTAVAAAPAVLEPQLAVLQRQEEQLASLYDAEFEKAKAIDTHLLKQRQALDAIERVQALHDSILAQLRQWQLNDQAVANGQSGVKVTVLKAPALADDPIRPPSKAVLAICALIGLVGGFGLIMAQERFDPKVWSAERIKDRLRLPVIGHIPVIPTSHGGADSDRNRFVHSEPQSAFADAFRALRSRLDNSDARKGRVIQLTSPAQGEGKSTIVANLAFSFAQLGRTVIVVDADLRHGSLHEVFDVPNLNGLTSVLRDGVPPNKAIHRSSLAAVDVLPRGSEVANPVDLLGQPALGLLLDSLRSSYDIVLLDAPPLLCSSDAFVISPKADRILLNVSMGRTLITEAARATELLESLGISVSGIVVNRCCPTRQNGGSNTYHHHSAVTTPSHASNGKENTS